MNTPVDVFLQYEKTASLGDFARGVGRGVTTLGKDVFPKNPGPMTRNALDAFGRGGQLGQAMQVGGALAASGVALAGVGLAVKKIHEAVSKRQEFKEMLETDPSLVELQGQNPKMFNAAYSSLRSINPTFGRDPLVAGAHMRMFMDNPETIGLQIAKTVRPPDARRQDLSGLSVGFEAGPLKFTRGF